MPALDRFYRDRGQQVGFLVVAYDNTAADVRRYFHDAGYPVPALLDSYGSIPYQYDVAAFPTQVFIDPEGRIASVRIGTMSADEMWQEVKRFVPTKPPPTYRTFTGTDRYQTAIMVSKKAYPQGAPAVFLVKGDNFPDALAAAPLAAAYGGPVVITPSSGLTSAVSAELQRLNPEKVFFIGLPDSVNPGIRAALPSAEIITIRGTDRYHTAVLLAEELRTKLGNVEKVVLAAGDKFPDALSVAPLAAKNGWAILLTPQAGPLPQVTADEVTVLGATKALRVGTYVKLPAQVTSVVSLVGTDRYHTSALIAAYAKNQGLSFAHVALATGENYPDALVVAPYLVTDGGILLLTQPTALPTSIRTVLIANAGEITALDFVGLPASIQAGVKGVLW